MENEQGITILEAVETLASIADLSDEESKRLRKTLRLEGKRLGERKVDWLQVGTNETHLGMLRKSLDTVHSYFKTLWREQDPEKLPRDVREGIRTIWVLVGHAVDSLSTYGDLFREYGGSPKNLPEYQELQSFYQRKINPKIEEGKLGRFVLGIGHLPFPMLEDPDLLLKRRISLSPQHLIVDLESLKSDQDYELLLIRKSDGSRFYNPRLIRNLKLISEVGFQEKTGEILPLFTPWRWIDRQCEKGADVLLEHSNRIIEPFLKERGKFKERDLSRNLTYGVIALLLSVQPRYLSDNAPLKTTAAFFQDLLEFLGTSVDSFDYRRLLTSVNEHNRLGRLLYQLPQVLSHALFTEIPTFPYDGIVRMLQGGEEGRSGFLAEGFQLGYQWIEQELKGYGNSPLKRDLESLEEGIHLFDPIKTGILPAKIGEMRFGDHTASLHRLAAPVKQEVIDQVTIDPLFLAALREMKARGEKVLIFNLQERSHWKERARAEALEKLSEKEEWSDTLQVVTLDLGSEFYNQELHFERGESAENFIENCRQFLLDENGSNYFSSQVEEILFPGFMEKTFLGIHQLYFASRNAFTPDMKRHFIDLINQFIQLKVVDALHPDRVIFLDKDGTDTSSIASTLFMMSPKLFRPEGWVEKDLQTYEALLYSSTLLYRERNLLKGKFDRFLSYVNWLEQAKNSGVFREEFQLAFGPLLPNGALAATFIPAA
jgi:hypothetical protein